MQVNRLFNLEIIEDIMLGKAIPTYNTVFTNEQMSRYLKFIIQECGLGGVFISRTPREYIEGFTDPLLY